MNDLWPINLTAAWTIALLEGCTLLTLCAGLGRLLFRQSSRYKVLITDDGPPLDSLLPPLSGTDPRTGEPVTTAECYGRKLVVLFVSPDCGPSADLVEALQARRRGWRDAAAFLVVIQTSTMEAKALVKNLAGVPVIADPEGQLIGACSIERMPMGLLVDATSHVRMKGIVNTRSQLAGLIAGQGRPMGSLSWEDAGGLPFFPETVIEQSPAQNEQTSREH